MKYKILIVEDVDKIAEAEKKILESAFKDVQIHIDTVSNKKDALSAINGIDPYDLVIADLNLDDDKQLAQNTSGFSLLKELSVKYDSPKIMIRSSYPSSVVAKYCLELGLFGYIETCRIAKTGWKSIDEKNLISAVKRVIDMKRDSLKKGCVLNYGNLKYDYDQQLWFCDKDIMDLKFPYNKLLLFLVEHKAQVISAKDLYNYLDSINANYISHKDDSAPVSNKIYYRIHRLKEFLSKYQKEDLVKVSPGGGYYVEYLK